MKYKINCKVRILDIIAYFNYVNLIISIHSFFIILIKTRNSYVNKDSILKIHKTGSSQR